MAITKKNAGKVPAKAKSTTVRAKPAVAKAKPVKVRAKPAVAKAKPVKAAPVKTVARKPSATKAKTKTVAQAKSAAAKSTPGKSALPSVSAEERLSAKDLQGLRAALIDMRDRLNGKIVKMRQQSLRRDDEVNTEEDGTDAFDRLFVLERVGGDQEVIYRIDEALRAIAEGTYGTCESCQSQIQRPRLAALPFAKNCIRCQSELERGAHGRATPRRLVS